MKVAIRADGGPELGYGHLVRTGALATELLRRDINTTYITTTPKSVKEICPDGIQTHQIPEENEQEAVIEILRRKDSDVIVTDSYGVDQEYQKSLSDVTDTVAVIQGDARYDLYCDILINGHVFAADIEYNWAGEEPKWCLGPEYLLLREEFSNPPGPNIVFRENPERAIILMGGSDVNNRTPEVMAAFDNQDISVDVIIGPGYNNKNEIRRAANNHNCRWNVHQTPNNLSELMFKADFAVTALGTTTYELIATNTPVIGLVEADNQLPIARALSKQRLGTVIWENQTLHKEVDKMITSSKMRKELWEKYSRLIDGNGAIRIVNGLINC
ncbi:UDP-2,4-diacetamido-2,4,6-trideoxy-beta-L-altropyranose hydrolase [Halobacteria archaeon AArc-m2/3/4]|uniref:UDP-2,4-diacetamido-2,4, 6-trideoxy-beta-L-altropyranose hydrolase n=1 Tax=Natronoglomus mannanivorans TaxID=2979990 RepID=A0ABT2QJ84_9EURY|nr:UDP-2,4-diacetamido-2,4,6-trideoxy-beta-L-altropyranose hydrolase [Halobacteria archaeon AArc-m2/3/4]